MVSNGSCALWVAVGLFNSHLRQFSAASDVEVKVLWVKACVGCVPVGRLARSSSIETSNKMLTVPGYGNIAKSLRITPTFWGE